MDPTVSAQDMVVNELQKNVMKKLFSTKLMKKYSEAAVLSMGVLTIFTSIYIYPVQDQEAHLTVQALLVQIENHRERFTPAAWAQPGDVIEYRLKYVNTGKKQV
jgi:hypothetical protein